MRTCLAPGCPQIRSWRPDEGAEGRAGVIRVAMDAVGLVPRYRRDLRTAGPVAQRRSATTARVPCSRSVVGLGPFGADAVNW